MAFIRKLSTDQLIQRMTEELSQCDADFIAEICNNVMIEKIEYVGNNMFDA